MSETDVPRKPTAERSTADFWRACRYLYPHRKLVISAVVLAFIVGAAFTSGLTAMLPILRVLIYGDSVQGWVDRQIVETRLGVQLSEEPGNIRLLGIGPTAGEAARQLTVGIDIPPALLHEMADPDNATAVVDGAELPLGEIPWYLKRLHGVAHLLPADPVWSIGVVFGVLAALAIFGNF